MLITELVNSALKKYNLPITDEQPTCAFCNKRAGTIKHGDVIGGNFPVKDLFDSEKPFCEMCAELINNSDYRKSCWLVHSPSGVPVFEFLDLKDDKARIVHLLLADIEPPYYLALTMNKKKHLIFGNINWNNFDREIVFDGKVYRYNLKIYRELWQTIDVIYNDFIQPKRCIKSGEYSTAKLTDEQFYKLIEIDNLIKPYRREISFELMVDFLPKREPMEAPNCKETMKNKPEQAQFDFLN